MPCSVTYRCIANSHRALRSDRIMQRTPGIATLVKHRQTIALARFCNLEKRIILYNY